MSRRLQFPLAILAATILASTPVQAGEFTKGLVATSTNSQALSGEAGDLTNILPLDEDEKAGLTALGQDMGGYGASDDGIGLYGRSNENYGVWGISTNYRGITGRTNRIDNNYGFYTPDNLFALNSTVVGTLSQIVYNDGPSVLEVGDVVVFAGILRSEELQALGQAPDADAASRAAATLGSPIIKVARASGATNEAFAGIVVSRFALETIDEDLEPGHEPPNPTPIGPIPPGEYALIVVRGAAEAKIDPTSSPLQIGDALTFGSQPATVEVLPAVWVEGAGWIRPGKPFGVALESSQVGQGRIFIAVGSP